MELSLLYWLRLEGIFQGVPQKGGQRCSEIISRHLCVDGAGLGEVCAVVLAENAAFFVSC